MSAKYLDYTGLSHLWVKLKDYFQPKLVSGTNIKTINSQSVLGSGNLAVDASTSDISSSITMGGAWSQLVKKAWKIGNLVFFEIEATAGSFNANTQYTIATIASGYRPSDVHFASGYTTDGSYNPKGTVSVLVRATGAIDIRTQLASSSGAYVFISGFYVI